MSGSSAVRAIWGGELAGDRMTRFLYLDESGVANPGQEPWVVVAGIIIHADRQWKLLEERLSALADDYAPGGSRDGFVFHAKELWSGGKVLVRGEYPAERRWEALMAICSIPEEFKIPVVFGAVHRAFYHQFSQGSLSQKDVTLDAQVIAFGECVTATEYYMRTEADPSEVATVTVEHNSQTYRLFRDQHRQLKSVTWLSEGMHPSALLFWPVTRVVDSVNFCEKHDSSILQIADACAFVIRKKLEANLDAEPYWEAFKNQLMGFRPVIGAEFVKAPQS